jgi:serine protease Do
MTSGEYFDKFTFDGVAGARVTIRLRSDAFHPFVQLAGPGFEEVASSSAPAGGGAFLDQVLPNAGTYTVTVTSASAAETGAYTLDTSGFGKADDVPALRACVIG